MPTVTTKYICLLVLSMLVALAAPITPQADSLRLATPEQETVCKETPLLSGPSAISPQETTNAVVIPQGKTPLVTTPKLENGIVELEKPVNEIPANTNPVVEKFQKTQTSAPTDAQETTPETTTPTIVAPVSPQNTSILERPLEQKMSVTPSTAVMEGQEGEGNLSDIIAGMKAPANDDKKGPAESKPLAIPQNTKKLDFLEGTWRCDRGMAVFTRDRVKIDEAVYEFTFDQNGNGRSRVSMKNIGKVYRGSASAKLHNGVLTINFPDLPVYKKGRGNDAPLTGASIECRNENSYALCRVVKLITGQEPGNKGVFRFWRIH